VGTGGIIFIVGILYGALIHRMLTEPVDDLGRQHTDAGFMAPALSFHSPPHSDGAQHDVM
jgi:hypothetical protein